jgi:hypothetical protein
VVDLKASSYRGYLAAFGSLKYSPESSMRRFVLIDGDHNGGDPLLSVSFYAQPADEFLPGTKIVGYV